MTNKDFLSSKRRVVIAFSTWSTWSSQLFTLNTRDAKKKPGDVVAEF